jgi:hypothetical protein
MDSSGRLGLKLQLVSQQSVTVSRLAALRKSTQIENPRVGRSIPPLATNQIKVLVRE